jgi:starch phosphorylase
LDSIIAQTYRDPARWTAMSITNVARMVRFSADRTVREYASAIWGVQA